MFGSLTVKTDPASTSDHRFSVFQQLNNLKRGCHMSKCLRFAFCAVIQLPLLASAGVMQRPTKLPCSDAALREADRQINREGPRTGILEDVGPLYLELKAGRIYVFTGWIERVFDWQVVVITDRRCRIEASYLKNL